MDIADSHLDANGKGNDHLVEEPPVMPEDPNTNSSIQICLIHGDSRRYGKIR